MRIHPRLKIGCSVDPDQRASRVRFLLSYSELENVLANPRRAVIASAGRSMEGFER
jgi:hypothetical protein